MELAKLLEQTEIKKINGRVIGQDVAGIAYDSRQVKAGDIFIALAGCATNGNSFVRDALEKNAIGVVSDCAGQINEFPEDRVLIEVPDGRAALARLSANFYENPSRKLILTGITGTNGKTTTSYLIEAALRGSGKRTGVIGTIKYILNGEERPAPFTTPEAPEFQRLLAGMLERGVTHVVAEISSHALAQKRADCTVFKTAVFTNLTRDHLDYHKTMDEYLLAKKRLFSELLQKEGGAVINIDDEYGRKLACDLNDRKILTYGVENKKADILAEKTSVSPRGLCFQLRFQGRSHEINSPLIGMHNVYNILAAFGALISLGFSPRGAATGVGLLKSVKGRFEKVESSKDPGFLVVVDFAHTPDALERLILTARAVARGKVITLFGCGGDRDRGKRPQMGRIATSLSDYSVITSDNPRTERPEEIINEVLSGVAGENYTVVPDRAEAVKRAIEMANPEDIVLLAGKGHEDYQIIGNKKFPFSDYRLAKEFLEKRTC